MNADSHDIVIVGGGMVGASLACALAAGGRFSRVALVEGFPLLERSGPAVYQPSFDARSTALSLSSERFLARLGLWDEVRRHAQPIRQIHVSDRGRFGTVIGSVDDLARTLRIVDDLAVGESPEVLRIEPKN